MTNTYLRLNLVLAPIRRAKCKPSAYNWLCLARSMKPTTPINKHGYSIFVLSPNLRYHGNPENCAPFAIKKRLAWLIIKKIGRAHVCTPVTNAHLVCRLQLEKKKKN